MVLKDKNVAMGGRADIAATSGRWSSLKDHGHTNWVAYTTWQVLPVSPKQQKSLPSVKASYRCY